MNPRVGPGKPSPVTDTLEMALIAAGCTMARVRPRPRLLTDNGLSYIAGDPAKWLDDRAMEHVRRAPCHPQTQGKPQTRAKSSAGTRP